MEKLLYLVYSASDDQALMAARHLRDTVVPGLLHAAAIRKMHLAVVDEAVEPARHLRMQTSPRLPDALLSIWLDSCAGRAPLEGVLDRHGLEYHGYLVTESEPLANLSHPARPRERVYGMCQVALLQKPDRLSFTQWLDAWQGMHTQVAIDTQSTFSYRQNLVVRALTPEAPPCAAIVEENFPPEAMTSAHAFYNAGDDDVVLQRHTDTMMASCARFIDFDRIDVIPMSEYVILAG